MCGVVMCVCVDVDKEDDLDLVGVVVMLVWKVLFGLLWKDVDVV